MQGLLAMQQQTMDNQDEELGHIEKSVHSTKVGMVAQVELERSMGQDTSKQTLTSLYGLQY